MATYSILIEGGSGSDWWDGTESWGGETSEANRDAKYSTRIYTSMSAWEADRDASGDSEYLVIVGPFVSADTTSVTVDGMSSTIDIRCPITLADTQVNPARHSGVYSGTHYRLEPADEATALSILDDNFYFDGIAITGYAGQLCINKNNYREFIDIDNCIIKGGTYGIYWGSAGTINEVNVKNNVIYDATICGIYYAGTAFTTDSFCYNNTVYNCNTTTTANRGGIISEDTGVACYNNLSYNNGVVDFGNANVAGNYNFSKDDTAPGAQSIHGDTDGKTPDFVTAGSDFNLQSTSDAIAAGLGYGSDAQVPTSDIVGNSRSDGGSNTVCDIGAFEYVAAGGDLTKSVAEIIAITEVRTLSLPLVGISVSEKIAIIEATVRSLADPPLTASVSEKIVITESLLKTFPLGPISVSDKLALINIPTLSLPLPGISLAEKVAITESLTKEFPLGPVSVSDQLALTEVLTISVPLAGLSVSEKIAITEVIEKALEGAGLTVDVLDKLAIAESLTLSLPLAGISIVEQVALSENITLNIPLPGISVAEKVAVAEAVFSVLPLPGISVSEDIALVESVVANLPLAGISVVEKIAITEDPTVTLLVGLSKSLAEQLGISETATMSLGPRSITIKGIDVVSGNYVIIKGFYTEP